MEGSSIFAYFIVSCKCKSLKFMYICSNLCTDGYGCYIYYFNHLILTFLSPVTTTFCFASGRGCCHDSYVTFLFFTSVRKLDYKEN